MAKPPLILKQVRAQIDGTTTVVCLHSAGQIRAVGDPFETLAGDFQRPPFHINCRSTAAPYMLGFVNDMRTAANAELRRRPLAERRLGPGGEVGGRIPPAAWGNNPVAGTAVKGAGTTATGGGTAAAPRPGTE